MVLKSNFKSHDNFFVLFTLLECIKRIISNVLEESDY